MRAIAVLAVVLAHARIPGFSGGFIGVDVFFVISGFLITRLLLLEVEQTGRIDLMTFWTRRALRLLPNAYAALIATALLALFVFPVYHLPLLAREITKAVLQIANFHFALAEVDYFQSDGPASPVLHFWSLNVEEQFYIAWPLLLLGICLCGTAAFRRRTGIVLGVLWLGSFTASTILTAIDQPVAYFTTPTRCWQLCTGALLALGWQKVAGIPDVWRMRAAWCGLVAVLAAIFILDESLNYPGLWALWPTLAAAALLAGFGAAKPDGILRRGLSQPLMQWIGARSYSWYLWHWPLLALATAALPEAGYVAPIAVAASLAIAALAYAWIEQPMRRSGPI